MTFKYSKRYVYMISILPFLYLCHCRNLNFIPGLFIARETCSAILRFIDDQSSWNPGTCSIPSSMLGYCFGHKVLCIKNLHSQSPGEEVNVLYAVQMHQNYWQIIIWTLNLLSMLVDTVISFRSQTSGSGDHNSGSNQDIANRAARCVDHWGHMCCTAGLESGLTTVIEFASNLSEMSRVCCSSDICFFAVWRTSSTNVHFVAESSLCVTWSVSWLVGCV